ncbi:putative membrane protein [Xanthomonas translucens pv. phlei]|uniref:Putative membrane protein n=1 Tax=Xanthomonas graminis pv. phlei TaxID=487906 RepID=A0A0K3A0N1_9XANT|nr:putative membrane protein [Xanthomonas translucens pv. phlei]
MRCGRSATAARIVRRGIAVRTAGGRHAAVFALTACRSRHATARTAFALVAACNGLWGAGYLIFSAITDTGDLAFVARDLVLRPAWAWRLGMGLAGLWLCRSVVRNVAPCLPNGMPLLAA